MQIKPKGYFTMNRFAVDYEKYSQAARQLAAEGAVLLRNENSALPVRAGDTISLFGRTQCRWYKSGTGSGGMVNTTASPELAGALRSLGITLDETLIGIYDAWVAEHPFYKGEGWGQEPWSQPEMPLTDDIVSAAAKRSTLAVVTIGRTAGEDQDNKIEKGSYLLSDEEDDMLSRVTALFDRVAVVLNVGNIIDMRWVGQYKPQAVLYVWHGGQEGASATADVLTGRVNPCGKLSDTIAYEIADYPSADNFGEDAADIYAEDIYVGYRYFESAAKDKVMYPFGFGLSYTEFDVKITNFEMLSGKNDEFHISATVQNTGNLPGKEVVQIYCEAPQGKLGKPARVLCAYGKTKLLAPGAVQRIDFTIPARRIASYDDSGVTGHKSAWVLEPGVYTFYVGSSVRDGAEGVRFAFADGEETIIVKQLSEALAPVTPFERLKNSESGMTRESTPLRTADMAKHIKDNLPEARECTGNKGILFADVYDGFADIDAFIDQIPDEVLACIVRGEGMSSPKVTHGSAGGFGGLTDALKEFGIPPACCTDGPSGLRFDTGGIAFSLPNGTCIACSWNEELTEELFAHLGAEMRRDRVDLILGPGVNIHRHPLCGRNFEYFSEDPFLTGSLAAAELRGLARSKVSGTVKALYGKQSRETPLYARFCDF
jgi:beta-glucosidase